MLLFVYVMDFDVHHESMRYFFALFAVLRTVEARMSYHYYCYAVEVEDVRLVGLIEWRPMAGFGRQ